MVSTVRSLSNHYDTLRIKPTATGDEISNAFATQIKTARIRPDISVAQLAQISVAYETLRDPVRRRAYDASIGVNQEPKVEPRLPVTPEPRVASFIAASLREPVVLRETERRPQPDPVPEQWPVPRSKAPAAAAREAVAPTRAEMPPRPRVEMAFEPQQASPGISIDRKQATIGAGVAGVAILALALTLAPKQAGAPELATATAPAQAVTVGLPPATSAQGQSALPVQVPTTAAATRATAQPDAGTAEPADLATATSSDQAQPTQTADQGAVQSTPTDATTEEAAAQSPSADTPADPAPAATITAAKLPLPEATMARTIERIGYACGSIVSSSTVSPGVFKLVCSSGDTYQAAPVGGRYRFHRWGSH